jgi:hypothetical protein
VKGQRWFLIPTLLGLWNAAQAVTITPSLIRERVETSPTTAIAGNNGSGPLDGQTILEATPRFLETLHAQALDADPQLNASAVAVADVQQDTDLGAQALSSRSYFSSSASVVGSGLAWTTATSELLTTFSVDVDVSFSLTASVFSAGDLCESFVMLSQAGTKLFDLRVTNGVLFQTLSGQLLANQSYELYAFTGTDYTVRAEGILTGGGNYDFRLETSPVGGGIPPVPEPSTAGLLGLGLALSVLVPKRRRRRPHGRV